MKLPILILFLSVISAMAQDQKPAAPPAAPAAQPVSPCVILKRMGPADEITSHAYSFGFRGKQYQYVEGDLPRGAKFHGRLTDNDVRQIMTRGGRIQIVEPKYSDADLAAARKSCAGGAAGLTEAELDAPENPPSASGATAPAGQAAAPADQSPPAAAPLAPVDHPVESAAAASETLAKITVTSNPDGADLYVDGDFVGSAPAVLRLSPGKHAVKVSMTGFKDWERDITTEAGSEARLVANLEKSN